MRTIVLKLCIDIFDLTSTLNLKKTLARERRVSQCGELRSDFFASCYAFRFKIITYHYTYFVYRGERRVKSARHSRLLYSRPLLILIIIILYVIYDKIVGKSSYSIKQSHSQFETVRAARS